MGYQPYFVGPLKVGLERDLDSYLIPEDAFPTLENAYLWRGRAYKKGGYEVLGGLVGKYPGRLGTRSDIVAVRAAPPQVYAANTNYAPIEPGSLIIDDGVTTFTDNGIGGMIVTSGAGISGTINYTTGAYVVTFTGVNAGATVNVTYLVEVGTNSPVMGLATFDVQDSIEPKLVAFDLVSAYQFNNTTNQFDQTRFYKGTNNVVAWTGLDTDFFDTQNYQGAMFATNNVPGAHFYSITAIVTGATTQITTSVANNLQVGDLVYVNNATVVAPDNLNGKSGLVTIAGNPFTVAINSAATGAYTANTGVAWTPTLTKTAGGDGIRWFDGFTAGAAPATGWVNFNPPLDSTATPQILLGALLLFPYKGYLVVLNTVEGTSLATGKRFNQRARWSQYGSVYYTPPYPATFGGPAVNPGDEWYQIPGKGGFIDAPTGEDIVAAEFIKDTLVVYFESSTYKLTYTGNSILPFLWEKVNTEIGATSTFSTVPFDRSVISVGPNGLYSCDSINIDRIDRIIPDEVFQFHTTSNAAKRIQGIRDFYSESAQWTFIDNERPPSSIYPTKTLYYNYIENSFAIFKNSFTCFGHYVIPSDLTWAKAVYTWGELGRSWDSFISKSGFPIIVAGNQQGFVFQLQNTDGTLIASNSRSLVIQNITAANPSVFTVVNHNLQPGVNNFVQPGDFILIQNVGGAVALNGNIYQIADAPNYTTNTFTLIDSNGDPVSAAGYTFGGDITIIDNFTIITKNLNPFFAQGKSMQMGYADLFLEQVVDSDFSVDVAIDDSNAVVETRNVSMEQLNANPLIQGTANEKFWQRVYFETQGQFIKLTLGYSESQMYDITNEKTQFVLHGMILWMKPTGRMLATI